MQKHVWPRRKLVRFAEIGEIWERYNRLGVPNTRIYRDHIEMQYGVSISTFYKALNVPARRLLKEMGGADIVKTDERFVVVE